MNKEPIWRYPYQSSENYPFCYPEPLPTGILMYDGGMEFLDPALGNSYYSAFCFRDSPVFSSNNHRMSESLLIEPLPMIRYQWNQALNDGDQINVKGFQHSIFPLIYSVSTATIIACYLTVILFTKNYLDSQKPSLLIKSSSLLSTIQLLIVYITCIVKFSQQYYDGYNSVTDMVSYIRSSVHLNVIFFLSFLLLQLTQAQIVMRLFGRKKEKQVALTVGIMLSLTCEILWAVSTFYPVPNDHDTDATSSISLVSAFMYLFRISMAMIFAALMVVYAFNKRTFIFKKSIMLLTLITLASINLSFGFFVADVSNLWVNELSDVFNLVSYLICNVVAWEWVNRVSQLEKMKQKQGVLGRPVYEDDFAPDKNVLSIHDDDSYRSHCQNSSFDAAAEPNSRMRTWGANFSRFDMSHLRFASDWGSKMAVAVSRSKNSQYRPDQRRNNDVYVYKKKEVSLGADPGDLPS